jgi:hypothetical protein
MGDSWKAFPATVAESLRSLSIPSVAMTELYNKLAESDASPVRGTQGVAEITELSSMNRFQVRSTGILLGHALPIICRGD